MVNNEGLCPQSLCVARELRIKNGSQHRTREQSRFRVYGLRLKVCIRLISEIKIPRASARLNEPISQPRTKIPRTPTT